MRTTGLLGAVGSLGVIGMLGVSGLAGCSAARGSAAEAASTAVVSRTASGRSSPTVAVPSPSAARIRPVPRGKVATLPDGVQVTIGAVRPLVITPHDEGEIAGPAAAVEVEVRNPTAEMFDMSTLIVSATYGDGVPAASTDAAPSRPLAGMLATARAATGVYLFLVPTTGLATLLIDVSAEGMLPTSSAISPTPAGAPSPTGSPSAPSASGATPSGPVRPAEGTVVLQAWPPGSSAPKS